MTLRLVSDEKIAETSSKGNQEKWFDAETDSWYKLDQFGYEALAEAFASELLARSNLECDTPFSFVRYHMERLYVHGRERTGCVSRNFLRSGQSLITLNRLLSNHLGMPLKEKLARLSSDKRRVAYLAEMTAAVTGLVEFPRYLTALFEIDALICNDDRHLNNIAVVEQEGKYHYCPIFDNGAGLLSNTQLLRMDIEPKALLGSLHASPFNITFTRQRNSVRSLYGAQIIVPRFTSAEIRDILQPLLTFYAVRDRELIAERVIECVLLRQRA